MRRESRSEMVAVFIAVLELCRDGRHLSRGLRRRADICSAGTDTFNDDAFSSFSEDETLTE
jgi:hypothetical protein